MRPVLKGSHNSLHCRVGTRRDGFSHPARFERLEERLALSAAPGTTEFGFPSPASGVEMEQGLVSLPGAASPTNGTNPANIALANVTGTQIPDTRITDPSAFDALAFSQPSFIPNDRPPMPGYDLPPEYLGINITQVANTPYGIRNFEIGANTGLSHGNAVLIGRVPATARTSTDTRTAMSDRIGDRFGDSAAADQRQIGAVKGGLLASVRLNRDRSQNQPFVARSEPGDEKSESLTRDHPPPSQFPPPSPLDNEPGDDSLLHLAGLDAAAVDQMMAGIESDAQAPDKPRSGPATDHQTAAR